MSQLDREKLLLTLNQLSSDFQMLDQKINRCLCLRDKDGYRSIIGQKAEAIASACQTIRMKLNGSVDPSLSLKLTLWETEALSVSFDPRLDQIPSVLTQQGIKEIRSLAKELFQ